MYKDGQVNMSFPCSARCASLGDVQGSNPALWKGATIRE